MDEYSEVTRTVTVPANTGVQGFLRTIEEIIRRPRVQQIVIESDKVTYKRFVSSEEEEPKNFNLDLTGLQPHHIIRNAPVEELPYPPSTPAAVVVGMMLDVVSSKTLTPIAFATGADTALWRWLYYGSGLDVRTRDRLFGYKLYTDRAIPDTTLVLCAGYGYTHSLVDTRVSVKAEILDQRPLTTMEIR